MSAEDTAAQARQEAARYLAARGITVLDRDWDSPHGTIPVVAEDNGVLVAVEVVTRTGGHYRVPLERIAKARRLRRAAALWLAKHGRRSDEIRVDVIGLLRDGSGGFTVEHIRAAG
jgi:putative endonuclease